MFGKNFHLCTPRLAIALFIVSSHSHAVEPTSIDEFIKHTYPDKDITVIAGKLRPGAGDDYALCLNWRTEDNAPMEGYGKILIINKSPAGHLNTLAQSPAFQTYRTTKHEAAIKKGILKYTYGYSNGCCSGTTNEYKFRWNNQGNFQLIGREEITEEFTTAEDNNTKSTKSGISTNYLTQESINWTIENGKRKEIIHRAKNMKIITLEEFYNN